MMDDQDRSPERLIVVEIEGAFVVTSEGDPSDWIACFTQDATFPAHDWAERMAELYNLRERTPENAPPFTGMHHPRKE